MTTPDRDSLADGLVRIGEEAVAKSKTHCSTTTTPTTIGCTAPPMAIAFVHQYLREQT